MEMCHEKRQHKQIINKKRIWKEITKLSAKKREKKMNTHTFAVTYGL